MTLRTPQAAKGWHKHGWPEVVTRTGFSAAPVPSSPYLALVELVQADGTAIDLTGPAPEWFAGMVPPCFQR